VVQDRRLGRARTARVVVHRDAMEELGELRAVQSLRTLLDQAEPEVHVSEKAPLGSRREGRPGAELERASDVVHERGGEQQVAAKPRMELRRLARERRDADRVLEQAAGVGVVILRCRRERCEVAVAKHRLDGRAHARVRQLGDEEVEKPAELVSVAAQREPADDDPVVSAISELGPLTGPQLREATGLDKKAVDRAVASLHHRLVLTSSHLVEQDGPWGALAHDLVDRKWRVPKRVPGRDAARRELASLVLDRAGELTAADLAGVFAWRRKEAAAILDEIADGRDDEAGFRIWTRR